MAARHGRWLGTAGAPLILGGCRASHSGSGASLKREYDAVVIGAGHNGLVAAAYLQKGGLKTAVLERRHLVGGAAVTEEIIPGFRFSRASYLLSLLRPWIYTELELKVWTMCRVKHGLKVLLRDPYSFTPLLEDGLGGKAPRSLLLGNNLAETQSQIAQFSVKDAQAFPKYEAFMSRLVSAIDPLLDTCPVDTAVLSQGSLRQRLRALRGLQTLFRAGFSLGKQLPQYYEVLTAPISKVCAAAPCHGSARGSPGGLGLRGWWHGCTFPGLGPCCNCARGRDLHGEVARILLSSDGKVQGVGLQDGTEVKSHLVLSNASPQLTFLELTPQEQLPLEFVQRISQFDTRSPVTKINVAVDRLPNFLAASNTSDGCPSPHHQCSIHLNCEDMHTLHQAFEDACCGRPSSRPMIELCIPSALDPTLAPPGCHVVSLFTQYTPYTLAGGKQWDSREREDYADRVFDCVEAYAPGFKASVIGRDVLTPPDLERIFGLPGGNIFHGAMSLDQLYFARPVPSYSNYRSPIRGLYLCGSGAHPGGGVMGAAGRNAATTALEDFKNL
ncbi:pyridine nucleotide-disulfide oxidoreductase domain-containing protein 2 isoform X3 [Elgaria multicarinata webbii]|uniref:pyridine nucleotide-disulfide oxidoreductase domain-containing protein 2 isoform X3 n=1 Tax=Elgaria multicarinata webbii TaxID=159646 RepID=UPI002FCD5476